MICHHEDWIMYTLGFSNGGFGGGCPHCGLMIKCILVDNREYYITKHADGTVSTHWGR